MSSASLFARAKARVGESLDGSKARNCVCAKESPRKRQWVSNSKTLTDVSKNWICGAQWNSKSSLLDCARTNVCKADFRCMTVPLIVLHTPAHYLVAALSIHI